MKKTVKSLHSFSCKVTETTEKPDVRVEGIWRCAFYSARVMITSTVTGAHQGEYVIEHDTWIDRDRIPDHVRAFVLGVLKERAA